MSMTKRIVAMLLVLAMVVPGVNAKAASYSIVYDTKLVEVANLVDEIQEHTDVTYYVNGTIGNTAAVEVDLTSKSDGIAQLRMYSTRELTDRVNVYVVREKDLGSAVHLTGTLSYSYGSVNSSDQSVQGYKMPYSGFGYWNVALSGGQKYYFVIESTTTGTSTMKGEISVALAFKKAMNRASLGSVALGKSGIAIYDFLSITNYEREYTFSAKAGEESVLYFAMDGETAEGKGSGSVNVYDETGALVGSKQINGSQAGMTTEFSLSIDSKQNHNYRAKATGIYGNISMRLVQTYGSVTLEKGKTTAGACPITIKLDGASATNIQYVKGEYSTEEIEANTIWNTATHVTGNQFTVNENGHYIVRVTLSDGRKLYTQTDVYGIDSVAPTIAISGYSNGVVKFTKSSADNDIDYMTVNGTKIIDGARLAEEGVHTFVIADTSGNKTERTVCIDFTAPTFTSDTIKDGGEVDAGYHRFNVNDNYSGVKQVKLDGVELSLTNLSVSISDSDVRHYIEIIDNCGNTKSIAFKSKKSNTNSGYYNYGGYDGIVR